MFDTEEEYMSLIKLVSGEEIVAMTSDIQEDDDVKLVMLNHPCKISTISNPKGYGVKFDHWMKFSDDFVFIINFDRIITQTRVRNPQLRFLYNKFIEKYGSSEISIKNNNHIKMNKTLGLIGSVSDTKSKLESLFKSKSVCSN
tara:strand:+ start:45 stop:473 length:429 start_codon:yes stop_codon:yes gene_type:complete